MIPELFRLSRNPHAVRKPYPEDLNPTLSRAGHEAARECIAQWPDYDRTPLLELGTLGAQLNLARVWVKDESARFGLGAFKALGGAYAVYRLLEREILRREPGARVTERALREGEFAHITERITIACASAGNHGRAVAWGAQRFGANCIVYLYRGVSDTRKRAIQQFNAQVNRDSPNYDEAVRRAAADAAKNGWLIVSDTSYEGYTEIPRDVMHGYTLIAQEVLDQIDNERPTHVLVQAGVGGFAAAIAAYLWQELGAERPVIISVEPDGAACVMASIEHGARQPLENVSSILGGLNCGEVSLTAWDVLDQAVDYAVAIPDVSVPPAMHELRTPAPGDPVITAGESGAAGVAALRWLATDPEARREVGLSHLSRVLCFVTEGANDPLRYRELTTLSRYT